VWVDGHQPVDGIDARPAHRKHDEEQVTAGGAAAAQGTPRAKRGVLKAFWYGQEGCCAVVGVVATGAVRAPAADRLKHGELTVIGHFVAFSTAMYAGF
jgi:hypothetical protein